MGRTNRLIRTTVDLCLLVREVPLLDPVTLYEHLYNWKHWMLLSESGTCSAISTGFELHEATDLVLDESWHIKLSPD